MSLARNFFTNLLVVEGSDFDVILGMDWLIKAHAVIDYQNKSVEFRIPDKSEFKCSSGSKDPGQEGPKEGPLGGNLAIMDVEVQETPKIVKEFLDVFPVDLPELPPDREIKFTIDVLPCTAPIFNAS